jgi:crotonobetainyl-CoA:carnitine CoA-transferase CaiB-like acyl-CoA transferase
MAEEPLKGLRAIEFGQLLAGPFTGTLLGDFGADVIKIEAPGSGDAMRDWGRLRHNDHSLWWSILARNKRSVTLNLREAEGQRIAQRLASTADVILENFRPGTMEKWGLGPDDVHQANPRAIYARVSGYGQTGRYAHRPGFASAGEALSGLRYINGYPGQAPPRCGISLGDTLAAQSCFQGILLALYARDARGATGQVVDAAILDACFSMLESTVPEYDKCGVVREPSGTVLAKIAPSNVYLSSDGKWVVIAANHDTLFRRLCAVMGRPELADDPRFSTHAARGERMEELDAIIGEWAAQHTAKELDRIVNEASVVCAPVYTIADVFDDPHFRERGLLVEMQDPELGELTAPGVVPKLSGTPGGIRHPGTWTVGGHNDEVLGERLHLGPEELTRLREEGVL